MGATEVVMKYPSVFRRYIAALIDVLVVLGLLYVVAKSPLILFSKYAFPTILLYEPLFTSFLCTLGQLLMGFRVRTFDGHKKINILQAVFRYIVKYILGAISFITMPAQKHRRGLHDLFTKTIVINESVLKTMHQQQEDQEQFPEKSQLSEDSNYELKAEESPTYTQATTKIDSSNTASSRKEKLLELKMLVDEGLISEEDYEQAKKQVIGDM